MFADYFFEEVSITYSKVEQNVEFQREILQNSEKLCGSIAQKLGWRVIHLTLTRITGITYVVVFLFTFCKQSHNKKFPFVYGTIIVKKLNILTKSNTKQILTKNNQFTAETQCPHFQVLTSCLCLGHTPLPQSSHHERVSFLHSIYLIVRFVLTVFNGPARTLVAGNPTRTPALLTLCF